MKYTLFGLVVLALVAPAMADDSLAISLGVRETNLALPIGSFNTAGNPGGTPGGIEWFRKDAQNLPLDGNWYQFSYSVSAADIDTLGGLTGNGLIGADTGTLEHIRIKNNGASGPITTWIDEIRINFDTGPLPPPATNLLISTFDNDGTGTPFVDGKEVMFQEPTFSGSTSANLLATPSSSGIDNLMGHDDLHSVKAEFQFVDNDPARWIRYTTFCTTPGTATATPQANPQIAEVGGPLGSYTVATVTFWMRGVPEPASLMLCALGGLAVLRRQR